MRSKSMLKGALCEMVKSMSFFFSSRRRHTRSKRDWSSDVCSSDLIVTLPLPPDVLEVQRLEDALRRDVDLDRPGVHDVQRSEERRVGKECRSRWWQDH